MKYKILIAGDICEDVYLFSSKKKENPESTSPIYVIDRKETKLGMSGNIYNNIMNMGCTPYLLVNYKGQKIQKTRLYYQDKYIQRIDNDKYTIEFTQEELAKRLKEQTKDIDALIVCDYGKGFWDETNLSLLPELSKNMPIFVDPYATTPLKFYKGATFITPNYKEGIALTGETSPYNICKKIQNVTDCPFVLLKMGAQGCYFYTNEYSEIFHLFPAIKTEEKDVCGAGDTFISALCSLDLKLGDTWKAIEGATELAGLTVQKIGVYAPTEEEWKIVLTKMKKEGKL